MDRSFIDLFEAEALKTPENIAVIFSGEGVSYRELNERSNMLANFLRAKGVKEETLVPLYIERGINMVVGMLGIMKAGGAYVPIDTDFPPERISYMLQDTGALLVVSSNESGAKLPGAAGIEIIAIESVINQPKDNLPTKVLAGQLAYVIYTSGSTGTPKGVMVTHGNLVDYISGLTEKVQLRECSSFALVSTIATDLGNTVIYGSLATGGTLHLFTKEAVSNTTLLHRYFATHQIDCLKIVPSHWKVLNIEEKLLLPEKLLIFGGEALPEKVVEAIRLTGTQCRIVNHYGPTETTIGKLLHIVEQGAKYEYTVPIGKPFSNTKVLVLTKNLKLCPIGVPGQLYITGDGVARGYLNNPELTKEKFIPNPFSKQGYAVMYSTGDLVKYLPDGNISFIGRVDNQVKIRGYRIELGEIESILQKSGLVSQAVVLAREDKQGNKRLAGYIVAEGDFDREGILAYLKDKLPDYMIPTVLMEMESFPLTANGKIDRNALPDPDAADLLSDQYVAPRNDVEAKLAALWQDILEVEQVGMNDDFFELGGHSLLAVRLVSAIRKAFAVEMPIGDIFDYPTVGLLATQLANNTGNDVLTSIEQVLPKPAFIPLSFSQERLWFIDRLEGSVQYQVPAVLRLKGTLNKEALAFALQNIVARHEVLRTVIRDNDGEGYQLIKNIEGWQMQYIDGAKYAADSTSLQKDIQQLTRASFNLAEDFMLRAALITLGEEEHILVVTMHHIASDGWSTSIIVGELVELYSAYVEGRTPQLKPLSIQYADFAIWQRNYLKGEVLEKKLGYWRNKLGGVLPLQMPTDLPRPVVQSTRGAIHSFRIDKDLSLQIQELCRQQGTTMFMTLLAAYKVLLYRYSGQADICVGSAIAGRQQQETEGLVGFFINTLALRSDLGNDPSFSELLHQVKTTTMEAYEHQELPFEKVVDAVIKERDMSRSPVFQVAFVLQNTPDVPQLKLGDVELSRESFDHVTAQFELVLRMVELPNGLFGSIEYCTDLYTEATISRMMDNFRELLRSIVHQPKEKISRLSILSGSEQHKLLVEFNDTAISYPLDKTLIALFEEQVTKTPHYNAVEMGDVSLTYQQLNERANELGNYLKTRGVKAETLVPICIDRTIDMVVAILAVFKAGGTYVPIDPEYPEERINYMLEDTEAKLVICSADTEEKLSASGFIHIINLDREKIVIGSQAKENLPLAGLPNHLAYIIYTSGSTGTPKGVMIEQKGVVNLCYSQSASFGLQAGMRTLQFASFGFDASCSEIFNTLLSGGSLVLCSKDDLLSAEAFESLVKKHNVEIVTLPCSYQHIIKDSLGTLKTIVSAGEALQEEIGRYIQSRGIRLINAYGPTENTVCVSLTDDPIKENKLVVIGKPIANVQVHIIDTSGNLAPIGSIGEIYVAGVQVARGYLNREELTEEKFVNNPFSETAGAIMYKTGDLGKWQADGNIEFFGRRDEQVKVRGYRVELGEIEHILQQCELVKQAVVLAREDKDGGKRLVGYIIPEGDFDREGIINYLSIKLPEYMVPGSWIEMTEFPLTANGKIDRKAMPEGDSSALSGNTYEAARNETEQKLVNIWQELLEVEKAGVHDDFFELGGHSLLAIRLISAIRKELAVELPISDVFDNTTIASQALLIENKKGEGDSMVPAIVKQLRPEQIPLSYSQERLWFIDQMAGSVQYHIPTVLRLKGKLEKEALENALHQIVNRHEILRTVYRQENGKASQYVNNEDEWGLSFIENSIYKDDPVALQQFIQQLVKEPFDLSKDNMLRVALIVVGVDDYVLVATLHHIASDGWSTSIIVKELLELYNAKAEKRTPSLPALNIQYADFAIWQRNYLDGAVLEKKIDYWKEKLNGVAPLELPTENTRPAIIGTRGASMSFTVPQDLLEKLQALGQQKGVTIFMTLLAAFKVLLYRYTGQQDICVGTPVAGRQQQEVENLIGFFINTIALRTDVNGNNSFEELLQKVRSTTMEAYENQEVPFEKVVEVAVKERNMSKSPVFQVMFVLQNTPAIPVFKLGDVELSAEAYVNTSAKFELTLNITETDNGLQASIQYNTELYNEQLIGRMVTHFKELLQSIIKAPQQKIGALPMLSREEELQLMSKFNDNKKSNLKDKSIIELFEQQVVATPNATAVVFEDTALTYHELNIKVNQLAHFLRNKGVREEILVPICIERSLEMIVGILAILKAGGAYVPLDASYPSERISYMVGDTGAKIIVVSKKSRSKLELLIGLEILEIDDVAKLGIDIQPVENLNIPISPNKLAYIIYTSGSTGRPKGVLIDHGNVVSLVMGIDYVSLSKDDILLSTGSPSFDATTFEYWAMLLNGGQLVLCREARLLDAALLKEEISKRKVTRMWFTSSWFNQLIENDITVFKSLKTILVGGEKLSENHIRKIRETYPAIEIINGYGPTENTTFSLTYRVNGLPEGKAIPIGTPLNNRVAYILNNQRQLVPVGVTGEIYLGGAGLSRGYLNNADLSKEKFVKNPFENSHISRLYKTGDLGRWLPDGNIEYLGRIDDQVKIRGFRIELGEIEHVLLQSGLVKQAAIIVKENKEGHKRMIGYVVPAKDFTKETATVYLKNKLPDYMVPAIWLELESFPLTTNGKIDKKALPDPEVNELISNKYVAPRNEMESKLVDIWQQLLNVPRVGIYDNFFELGGHSLLVMRLVSAIRLNLNLELSINDIFIYPTIRDFARNQVEKFKNPSLPLVHIKYLVPIKTSGDKIPLYIVAGGGGTARRFMKFAEMMDADQPVYVLQPPIDTKDLKEFPDTIEKIAAKFIEEIQTVNPYGPYSISGHCIGGIIAFEMAKQLQKSGKKVQMLAMFDTILRSVTKHEAGSIKNLYRIPQKLKGSASRILFKINFETYLLRNHTRQAIRYKINSFKKLVKRSVNKQVKTIDPENIGLQIFDGSAQIYIAAFKKYQLAPYDGSMELFYAKEHYYFTDNKEKIAYKKINYNDDIKSLWKQYASSISIHEVEGEHSAIFDSVRGKDFAKLLQDTLNKPSILH